jgi:hypothetical protein
MIIVWRVSLSYSIPTLSIFFVCLQQVGVESDVATQVFDSLAPAGQVR